ncbi:very low-density lipoprotein receptor-like [Amblyraja radiata]|uniref:very low-density lipoprotein receptor-like n=1 Tax=Amblyraja radiata TaxID=386614 RepID=UPI0014023DE3|nr:very low-density lipoprotein receptor-like [Amblyraja radiata]
MTSRPPRCHGHCAAPNRARAGGKRARSRGLEVLMSSAVEGARDMCRLLLLLLLLALAAMAAAAGSVTGGAAVPGWSGSGSRAEGDVGCSKDEFQCLNGLCISVLVLCNGRDDCSDWSDEQNCTLSEIAVQLGKCGEFEFLCDTGQCIELQSVCDNFPDCTDGSDEANCNQNECLEANGKCSDYCWDLPLGYECACPAGLELINHFTCVDVDECRDSNVCDQICVNLHGSYKCECYQRYQRDPHSDACRAAGEEPFLIFTNHGSIRKLNINGMEHEELTDSLENAETLAVYVALSTIYWSDATHEGIFSKSMGQESKQIISDVQRIGGIAVDWIYGHIYWTEAAAGTLSFSTLDGLRRKTLFCMNLVEPAAVVVDPYSGVLYWADLGASAKIEKAGMDGADRRVLISIRIEKPTGLALDFIKNRLYWMDSGLHELFYSDLNGHFQRSILHSKKYLTNPFGLAVFENHIYWSDEESKTLFSADKFTGANVTSLAQNLTEPRSLVVYHKLIQPLGQNWCVEAHAACEFLCVPAPHTAQRYACLRPDDMKSDKTGRRCEIEMNRGISQDEEVDSSAWEDDGADSGGSQEEMDSGPSLEEEGGKSDSSEEEGGKTNLSEKEGEKSSPSEEVETNSSPTQREEKPKAADLAYLDAVSVGIIAIIVVLSGTAMCCAAVHWRVLYSRNKEPRCFSPVPLEAENSLIYSEQGSDAISQRSLL